MKFVARAAAIGLVASGSLIAVSPTANAAQKCEGTTYAGRCVTTSNIVKKSTVVESVPLTNKSSYTATMNCSFTTTITKSFSTSLSLTSSVKATVWSVVEASVSGTQSMTLSQTASQATTAGGSVKLPPGGKVICQRVYGYYTMTTKIDEWGPGAVDRTLTSTLPYSLGVTIING
jgi:hypothetical protein